MRSFRIRTHFSKYEMVMAMSRAEAALAAIETSHVGRSGPASFYASRRELRRIIDGSHIVEVPAKDGK